MDSEQREVTFFLLKTDVGTKKNTKNLKNNFDVLGTIFFHRYAVLQIHLVHTSYSLLCGNVILFLPSKTHFSPKNKQDCTLAITSP